MDEYIVGIENPAFLSVQVKNFCQVAANDFLT